MSPVSRKRKKKHEKRGPTAPKRHAVAPVHFTVPEPTEPADTDLPPMEHVPGAVRLRITLVDSEPLVWRLVEVPARITLAALHWVIQDAFAWEACHPHLFEVPKRGIFRGGEQVRNEQATRLPEPGTTFHYLYDFGDNWSHAVEVVEHLPEREIDRAVCLDGASAAPEEDCGGVWGWAHLCEILADPTHPEHEERLEWLGYVPDPHAFDIKSVNRKLAAMTFR